ncbi:MAG: DUF4258 domain-containing protein [Magnetococcales bacterium]|nr:DUF4258 domain-containing protein [Magnetococcales bacterium]MBF0116941.1 DUF4258 domain-containing protein [Magnetococcales bacterium]
MTDETLPTTNHPACSTWFSLRFKRLVLLTRHGKARMEERSITLSMVADLVETGEITAKNERNLWISKEYPERNDNLICAAVALEDMVVIKTVMHRWKQEERQS